MRALLGGRSTTIFATLGLFAKFLDDIVDDISTEYARPGACSSA